MIEMPSESLSYSPDPYEVNGRGSERRGIRNLPYDHRRRGSRFHVAMSRRSFYSGYEEGRLNGRPSN